MCNKLDLGFANLNITLIKVLVQGLFVSII